MGKWQPIPVCLVNKICVSTNKAQQEFWSGTLPCVISGHEPSKHQSQSAHWHATLSSYLPSLNMNANPRQHLSAEWVWPPFHNLTTGLWMSCQQLPPCNAGARWEDEIAGTRFVTCKQNAAFCAEPIEERGTQEKTASDNFQVGQNM